MSHIWRLQLLGGISARRVEGRDLRLRASRYTALLGYLSLRIGQEQPRDQIIEAVWPHLPIADAQHSLRQALVQLRHIFEPPGVEPESVIEATRGALRLNPETISVDITRFAAGIRAATRTGDTRSRIEAQSRIVTEYQGTLLPGIDDDWVEPYRRHFAEQYLRMVAGLIKDLEETGDRECALDVALQAAHAAPEREDTHLHVMRLYLALKRRREARNYWSSLANRLSRDSGYVPVSELTAFADRYGFNSLPEVEEAAPAPRRKSRTALSPPAPTRARSGKLPAVMAASSAASPGASSAPVTRRSRIAAPLPLVSTRLFGRREEIEELAGMLCPPSPGMRPHRRACVMATLSGPGGAGKTRLAYEFARAMGDKFPAGIAYVPLAPVSTPAEVLRHALQTIMVEADAKVPPIDQIAGALSGGPALLILDNAEHVVPGAADLAIQLLERLPDLRVLVTSRQALGWQGEQVVPVTPLAVPPVAGSPERMLEYPAIEMFMDRAQNIVPHFQLTVRNAEAVVAVCQRLEGLPLSIELAAARVRAAAPAEMLKELEDQFGFLVARGRGGAKHHATLQDTIAWSFDRLPESHQKFLVQLSVFRGGFTREAAETVCGMQSAFNLLEDLVNKSLIEGQHRDDHIRFAMLESVREFCQARMDAGELAALTTRHAAYYQAFAERQEPRLRSAASMDALAALDLEVPNIRAALVVTTSPGDLVKFAGSLWRYWHLRSMIQEGVETLTRAVAVASEAPGAAGATALTGLAMMHYRLGDMREANKQCERASIIARIYGVQLELAHALNVFGVILSAIAEYEAATTHLLESAALFRSLDDTWALAAVLNNLGKVERSRGDWQSALAHLEECELVYESTGSHLLAASVSGNIGTIYSDQGNYVLAEERYSRCLRSLRILGNRWLTAAMLNNLAETRLNLCDPNTARNYANEALQIRHDLGDIDGIGGSLVTLAKVEHATSRRSRALMLQIAAERLYISRGISPPRPDVWRHEAEVIRAGCPTRMIDSTEQVCTTMNLADVVRFALEPHAPNLSEESSVNTFVMESV